MTTSVHLERDAGDGLRRDFLAEFTLPTLPNPSVFARRRVSCPFSAGHPP